MPDARSLPLYVGLDHWLTTEPDWPEGQPDWEMELAQHEGDVIGRDAALDEAIVRLHQAMDTLRIGPVWHELLDDAARALERAGRVDLAKRCDAITNDGGVMMLFNELVALRGSE